MVQKPLIFIKQPNIEQPKVKVQGDFIRVRPKKLSEEKKSVEKTKEVKQVSNDFKELPIPQKLDYLLNLRDEIPQIKCDFVTKEQTYRGVAVTKNAEEVRIDEFRDGDTRVLIADLTNIVMIGF